MRFTLTKAQRRHMRGKKVRMKAGSLSGLAGIIKSVDGHGRITALFQLLGRSVPVKLCSPDTDCELVA